MRAGSQTVSWFKKVVFLAILLLGSAFVQGCVSRLNALSRSAAVPIPSSVSLGQISVLATQSLAGSTQAGVIIPDGVCMGFFVAVSGTHSAFSATLNQTGSAQFFSDSGCTSAESSVSFGSSVNVESFFVKDAVAETVTISVSSSSYGSASFAAEFAGSLTSSPTPTPALTSMSSPSPSPMPLTMGETSVLSTPDGGNSNLLLAQAAILSQSGTLESLSFYVTNAAGSLVLGVYDSSGTGGAPGKLVAQTASFAPVAGWNTQPVTSPATLAAGTYYLAYLPGDNNLSFVASTSAASPTYYYSYSFGAMPSAFNSSAASTNTWYWSFYATLLSAGGSATTMSSSSSGSTSSSSQITYGSGTFYYIAANGSDSNSGTSKNSPWLHAPGMTGCTANCASVVPQPGDNFIFRGGDTWHRFSSGGTGAMPVGLDWTWTWSGNGSQPIYIGVDKTWYAGGSWTRPVLSMDNPLSTSVVGSCAHDDTGDTAVIFTANYVTFDNFEMQGYCWSGDSGGSDWIDKQYSTYIILSDLYIHGWTHTSTFTDQAWMIHGNMGGDTYNQLVNSIIDGSDSPYRSGFAVYGDCFDMHGNTFRYLSNGAVCWNPTYIHDNLFEYIVESTDSAGTHGNVLEAVGGASNSSWFYNNVVRHTSGGGVGLGVNVWFEVYGSLYFYNNVFYDIGNPADCIMFNNVTGAGSVSANLWNNTIDAPCTVRLMAASSNGDDAFNGMLNFENNHLIGYSSLSDVTLNSGATYSTNEMTDVYQSESAANSQGYTSANNYAPVSSSGVTVGAGTNASGSCGDFGGALCSDTSLGNSRTPVPRPTSGAWDAGAYQFQ